MDDDEDEDSDGGGTVPDFRKRLRRQRDKDREAAAAANGDTPVAAAAAAAEGGEGEEEGSSSMEFPSDGTYRNKQRVLLFSSRGITSRFRHLLADLRKLIPHHKKVRLRVDLPYRVLVCCFLAGLPEVGWLVVCAMDVFLAESVLLSCFFSPSWCACCSASVASLDPIPSPHARQ